MARIYGSYKRGEHIFKDKQGYYVLHWDVKSEKEKKKHFKTLKNFVVKKEDSKRKTRKSKK
jgi:hypothetical protein